MKYVRCTVRDSRIRSEMSWGSTHIHCTQRLNHKDISMLCFWTPLAVIKDEIMWRIKMAVSKCPCLTLSRVNVMLDAKIPLVLTHQRIVPSTLLAPATNIRTYKATKPQRYICSNHWHMSYFFNNIWPNRKLSNKNKNKTKQKQEKKYIKKIIKIALSLGYPSSYFYDKRCNMLL